MKRFIIFISSLSSIALLFLLNSCFLFPEQKETLPPATQTGANTFGFLLNGKVWLPKGSNGFPNLSPSYDPNFHGKPTFGISSYRVVSSSVFQNFGFYVNGIDKEGEFYFSSDSVASASFDNSSCEYFYHDSTVYREGSIRITKLALPIISGTFDFILCKPGCDTIKITQGRFDFKFQ
ncbi:MAG: hypothetical protein QM734_14610 [Cyclobacteriaceae bacterium]